MPASTLEDRDFPLRGGHYSKIDSTGEPLDHDCEAPDSQGARREQTPEYKLDALAALQNLPGDDD